jgi:hypothetical protein
MTVEKHIKAGQLHETPAPTVYKDLTPGNWVHIFKVALQAFNQLGLPVKMTEAASEQSANVVMRLSSGPVTFEYGGNSYPGAALDPTRLHGATRLFGSEDGTEKAAVFLPSDPKSGPMYRGGRAVYEKATLDMMKVIAVHELIHACGLENQDHATDDGVFYFPLAPDGKGKIIVPGKDLDDKPMPPLRLGASTTAKLGSLWGS